MPSSQNHNNSVVARSLEILAAAGITAGKDIKLVKVHDDPIRVARSLCTLKSADILTPKNRKIVKNSRVFYPIDFANVLCWLNEAGILTQKNLDALQKNRYPNILAQRIIPYLYSSKALTQEIFDIVINADSYYRVLLDLSDSDILTKENINAVKNYVVTEGAFSLAEWISVLRGNQLLTQVNFDVVIKHKNPLLLSNVLIMLYNANSAAPAAIATVAEHVNLFRLAEAFVELERGSIMLTQENMDAVAKHADPLGLARAFVVLEQEYCLTQENKEAVAKHADPLGLARAFVVLKQECCLTQENKEAVAKYANPFRLAKAFVELIRWNIFTEEDKEAVAKHADPLGLAIAFVVFKRSGVLSQENKKAIAKHADLFSLKNAFVEIIRWNIFTEENKEAVVKHADPSGLTLAFVMLEANNMLIEENKEAVVKHADPLGLAIAFVVFKQSGVLSQENKKAIAKHADLFSLKNAFVKLIKWRIFTQENKEAVTKHANPFSLARAFVELWSVAILTPENKEAVTKHANPFSLARAFVELNRADILTPENREAVAKHANPERLAFVFVKLNRADILTSENKEAVAKHADPFSLAEAFVELSRADILTPENKEVVVKHADPFSLAEAFVELSRAGILTPENKEAVAKHSNPTDLTFIFVELNRADILTPENKKAVVKHADLSKLAFAFVRLNRERISTLENKEAVMKHAEPARLACFFVELSRAGMLTPENKDAVVRHANILDLDFVFTQLNRQNLLAQENANIIFATPYMTSGFFINSVWHVIPGHMLTQAVFNRLVALAQAQLPEQQLNQSIREYVDGLLERRNVRNDGAFINDGQSVHYASVHKSASESATKLFKRYQQKIKSVALDEMIGQVKAFVSKLDDTTPQHKAAKTCVDRITRSDFSFTDPKSNVGIRQLLALVFLAVNDDACRVGAKEDAENLFVNALYEIQRGYNLSPEGVDLGGEDHSICIAGTFNKLLEPLQSIHPDCTIIFMTHATAALKLHGVVFEEARKYLSSLLIAQEQESFVDKITKDRSFESIWGKIKNKIIDRMFDEFSILYSSKDNVVFVGTIETGKDIEPTDEELKNLKKQVLEASACSVNGASSSSCRSVITRNPSAFFSANSELHDDATSSSVSKSTVCPQT